MAHLAGRRARHRRARPSTRSMSRTHPGTNFTEGNASSIVIGEWNPSSIACAIGANCGNNLGNTFGTPQIRRLHNGNWAVIFGNGFGSTSGDAGIYIMSIDSASGAQTFYYLSTNTAGGNGIAYATPADMDGDHITDYVYAGDLLGNVWRFDLTSNNPPIGASRTPAAPRSTRHRAAARPRPCSPRSPDSRSPVSSWSSPASHGRPTALPRSNSAPASARRSPIWLRRSTPAASNRSTAYGTGTCPPGIRCRRARPTRVSPSAPQRRASPRRTR